MELHCKCDDGEKPTNKCDLLRPFYLRFVVQLDCNRPTQAMKLGRQCTIPLHVSLSACLRVKQRDEERFETAGMPIYGRFWASSSCMKVTLTVGRLLSDVYSCEEIFLFVPMEV